MYTIRKATIKDVETIRALAKEIWYDTYLPILAEAQLEYMLGEIYSTKKLSAQIKNNEQTFLVLIEDEQIVAFAAYSPREENPDIYKLHKIYCLPATQGKGYGKVLINTVCDAVIKAGKHLLELNVNRHNKAKDFYEKMGFKVIYEEDVPIGPYFMNDYVMRKEITDFSD
jgi:diamine N-acetyltransferase